MTIVREIFDPVFGRVTPFLRWVYMSVICCVFVAKRAGESDNSLTCLGSLGAVTGRRKVAQFFTLPNTFDQKLLNAFFIRVNLSKSRFEEFLQTALPGRSFSEGSDCFARWS